MSRTFRGAPHAGALLPCATETTYDWENEQWSVPVNVSASKLARLGTQLVSLGGGVRYWFDGPDSGADGLGLRITVTLLFPQ
jgi:hypothetical protein